MDSENQTVFFGKEEGHFLTLIMKFFFQAKRSSEDIDGLMWQLDETGEKWILKCFVSEKILEQIPVSSDDELYQVYEEIQDANPKVVNDILNFFQSKETLRALYVIQIGQKIKSIYHNKAA